MKKTIIILVALTLCLSMTSCSGCVQSDISVDLISCKENLFVYNNNEYISCEFDNVKKNLRIYSGNKERALQETINFNPETNFTDMLTYNEKLYVILFDTVTKRSIVGSLKDKSLSINFTINDHKSEITQCKIYEDCLYYSIDNCIYKIGMDGKNEQTIYKSESVISQFYITENKVYFLNKDGIFSVSLENNKAESVLSEKNIEKFAIYKDYKVYSVENKLCIVNDKKNSVRRSEPIGKFISFYMFDDVIYSAIADETDNSFSLERISEKGGGKNYIYTSEKNRWFSGVYIAENKLYCRYSTDKEKTKNFYVYMNLDGTNVTELK